MTRRVFLNAITVVVTVIICLALTAWLESLGVGLLGFLAVALTLGFAARTLSGLPLIDP
ncbi:hypothetical protein AB1L88_15520 [Tautonia sp. JC769]|uniref:hypothetical protein n=1 Tax=Tautonia sp. JC769 TaxID=3232135 RepID=UPI003459919B